MPEFVVEQLLVENRLGKGGSEDGDMANASHCFLDESVSNEVDTENDEEEDQPLDIAQLCLKAELATVLADQVEMLREKNLVLSQTVTNVRALHFS